MRQKKSRGKRREEPRFVTRGREKEESDSRIVGGVENEMDEEIDGGELGDGIGRIIGEEEITALRSLRDIGKHALHNSEEITTREL